MDLWQFYGYLKTFREIQKQEMKNRYFQNKMLECMYVAASFCGLDTNPDDFFKGEQEIDNLFNDKPDEEATDKPKDPIAKEGQWMNINGQEEWVYNFQSIMEFKEHIDKIR
jgi:hypothetical protein